MSLDKQQDRELRSAVAGLLDWNRQHQFGGYRRLLTDMADDGRGPISADTIQKRFQEMTDTWDASVAELAPRMAVVLKTLRPAQIEELFASIEKDNREYAEEFSGVDPAQRNARRERTAIKAIQRFTGRLDDSQRELVRVRVARMHDLADQWLAHRRNWQSHLRELIETRAASREFNDELRRLLADFNQFDDIRYRDQVRENQRQAFEMLAELSRTMTPRQRQQFGAKMREYIDTLDEIAHRAAAQPVAALDPRVTVY